MAQLGSALDWGSRGRRFKSCRPDSTKGLRGQRSARALLVYRVTRVLRGSDEAGWDAASMIGGATGPFSRWCGTTGRPPKGMRGESAARAVDTAGDRHVRQSGPCSTHMCRPDGSRSLSRTCRPSPTESQAVRIRPVRGKRRSSQSQRSVASRTATLPDGELPGAHGSVHPLARASTLAACSGRSAWRIPAQRIS